MASPRLSRLWRWGSRPAALPVFVALLAFAPPSSTPAVVVPHRPRGIQPVQRVSVKRIAPDRVRVTREAWVNGVFVVTWVQNEITNGASPLAIAMTSNTAAGNALVAEEAHNSTDAATIADTDLNTYTSAATVNPAGMAAVLRMQTWVSCNINGGALTVTFTEVGSTFEVGNVTEYSNVATSSCLDQAATGSANPGADPSLTTGATVQANEMLRGFFVSEASSMTVGSGFTSRYNNFTSNLYMLLEEKAVTSAGAQTINATMLSNDWGGIGITLKDTDAGGATFPFGILQNIPIRGGGLLVWLLGLVR